MTVLAPVIHLSGLAQWINIGLHYFAPAWTLIGWLLFGPRPRITTATGSGRVPPVLDAARFVGFIPVGDVGVATGDAPSAARYQWS